MMDTANFETFENFTILNCGFTVFNHINETAGDLVPKNYSFPQNLWYSILNSFDSFFRDSLRFLECSLPVHNNILKNISD